MTSLLLLVALLSPAAVLATSEAQHETDIFNRADINHDGLLDDSEMHHVFLDFDTNGDGTITKAEFVEEWTSIRHIGNAHEAQHVFPMIDKNHDGVLSADDATPVHTKFDIDGNGVVNLNEFLTVWNIMRQLAGLETVHIHVDQ